MIGPIWGDFVSGVGAVLSSFGLVRRVAGARVYVAIAVLCLALFLGGAMAGAALSGMMSDALADFIGGVELPDVLPGWVLSVARGVVGALSWLVVMFLVGILGGAVILIVLSPLMSHIADRVWVALGNPAPRDTVASVARGVVRGALVAVKYACFQVLALSVVLFVGFLPVVGFAAPFLALLVNAFFYGATFSDYALERAGLSAGRAVGFAGRHRAEVVGVGLPFAVAMLIPFLGSYLALFLAPASVAAGARVVGGVLPRDSGA